MEEVEEQEESRPVNYRKVIEDFLRVNKTEEIRDLNNRIMLRGGNFPIFRITSFFDEIRLLRKDLVKNGKRIERKREQINNFAEHVDLIEEHFKRDI